MPLVAAAALVLVGTQTVPAAADGGCAVPKGLYQGSTPWPQRQLDLPALAPLSIGTGQRIAVLGTGIDASNPQFGRGQVLPGRDLLGGGAASTDCDGRGTFAAGIIGAQPDPRTTVVGVAPGAQLLPIRYTQSGTDSSSASGPPARLAVAIDAAVTARATIIEVAVPVTEDAPALRAAVQRAQRAGLLVVSPAAAAKAGESTYPTSYPGVIAVAGVNADGLPVTAEAGSYLSVSAPGNDLVGLAAGSRGKPGQLWPANDPSFAAAYVAGALADLAAYLPKLNPHQLVQRLLATAGTSNGTRDDRTGWGLIAPLQALTAQLPADITPQAMAAAPSGTSAVPLARPLLARAPAGRAVGYLAAAGLALALLIGLGAAAIGRGQRRGWRPARAALPVRVRADR